MNFEEHAAKPLLAEAGIAVPRSRRAASLDEAEAAAREIGPCVVKAQAPTGKRGKAGGVKLAADPAEAHAEKILGMEIGGYTVETVLVEAQTPIARELYAAILNDPGSKGPMLLFSTLGGMDVEEAAEQDPDAMRRHAISITEGLRRADAEAVAAGAGPEIAASLADALMALCAAYRKLDAELIEINPLVVTQDGRVVALDCKLTVDDGAGPRQPACSRRARRTG